jgi:hypothetical protein
MIQLNEVISQCLIRSSCTPRPETHSLLYHKIPYFIMVNDSKNHDSAERSKESNILLNGMKRYLKIEHKDDDNELLTYLRKQAGLHQD